jgi:hypothetical protein
VIERAYVTAERLELWCQDEGGPYQWIPQPGSSFQSEGAPARRPHEYLRGGTAKLLTLFRPATGEVRAEATEQSTNAILHPWLKRELEAILKQCPPAPVEVPQGRRWQDWDIYPAAEQLDRFFPPVRVLLILDNLAGHKSSSLVQWCAEHGILLLWTPTAGSWLTMAESVQRIIKGRALAGQDYASVEALKQALDFRCRGLESSSNALHLGRQTPCASRSGLCPTSPLGRIRRHYDVCAASTHSLRSLLQEGGLMPQELATDPLVVTNCGKSFPTGIAEIAGVRDQQLLLRHRWGRHAGNRQALRREPERQVRHG